MAITPHVHVGDLGAAARRMDEATEHTDGGRLAGAVRAEKAEDRAGSDPEGKVSHGLRFAERFAEAVEENGGFAHGQNQM